MATLPADLIEFQRRLTIAATASDDFAQASDDPARLTAYVQALRGIGAINEAIELLNYGARLNPTHRPFQELMVLCLVNAKRIADAAAVSAAVLTLPTPADGAPPQPTQTPSPAPARAPSPFFQELTQRYRQIHAQPRQEGQYEGFLGLIAHLDALRRMVTRFRLDSLLDYGGGKGGGWRFGPIQGPGGRRYETIQSSLGVKSVDIYDPGAQVAATPPQPGGWDGVVCLDVLEHVPEQDVDWVLEEIFAAARTAVILNIALYPADFCFADGVNLHVTLKSPEWWVEKLERCWTRRPQLRVACYFSRTPCSAQSVWLR